jgi:guanylate kinase
MKKGILIVLSGPSGVGKGTICNLLRKRNPLLHVSISMTTRIPRSGELDGVHYYFVTRHYFQKMIQEEKLLEWACVYDHFYGTPLDKVQKKINAGIDVILEIDTQGAFQVRRLYPEAVLIFLLPPSLQELKRRITKRGSEKDEELKKRLLSACSEVRQAAKYDYIVVNDDINEAVENIKAIISSEKCRSVRLQQFLKEFCLQEENL